MSDQVAAMTETTETKIPCPNPRCEAHVSADQSWCAHCEHELGACPSCGKLMSKTIGKCGFCSYGRGIPKPSGEATSGSLSAPAAPAPRPDEPKPIVVRFTAARAPVTEVIAEAYHQAALADADMAAVSRQLEQVRARFLTEQDVFKTWNFLDGQVGAAEANTARPALASLRDWFKQQVFDQQRQWLGELFERNPEMGWREWLRAYADALAEWRVISLCQSLVEAPLPFPAQFRQPFDFKRLTRLIGHERWTEVHRFFAFLARQESLHPQTRARLLVPAGQIYLYYFRPLESALPYFEEAEKLAPSLGRVQTAFGEYYLQQRDFVAAQARFERAIALAPGEEEGYIFLGDLAKEQGDLETARTWYQEAVNKVEESGLGLSRLIRLYGNPELIEKYESHILPLAERAMAIDEANRYSIHLDIGEAYATAKRQDEAKEWYQKAIDLEPDRVDGYDRLGFAYLEEGESRYDDARRIFAQEIEVAPEAYYGYWGMGQLCEREEKWEETIRWYELVADRQPEFQSSIKSRIGEMLWRQEKYPEAEAKLFEALELDHTNDATLLDLADEYYQKLGQSEDAMRLYQRIREIKGPDFEAGCQNRIGNVYYYHRDYERAAQHYLKAIEADSAQAVYFTNLGGAYKGLSRWAEAREQFKQAYELNGNKAEYENEVALIYNHEGNQHYSAGDYERALECYAESIKLDPNLPRYFSNRALALEQLLPASSDPLKSLESALADAGKALELARSKEDPDQSEYAEQLARLEQQRSFINRYGHRALAFELKDKPFRVRLSNRVLAVVLNAEMTDLSEETFNRIEELRNGINSRYGLAIPGVNFAVLDEAESYWGDYQIEVMGQLAAYGQIEIDKKFVVCSEQQLAEYQFAGTRPYLSWLTPDSFAEGYWLAESDWQKALSHKLELMDAGEYLMRHIEFVAARHLDEFCGHQETVNLLEQCPSEDCAEINRDLHKLNVLTQTLKERLRQGQPITDFAAICEQVNRMAPAWAGVPRPSSPEQPAPDFSRDITSLALHLSQSSSLNREELGENLIGTQEVIFQDSGVIIPRVMVIESGDLAQPEFQLQINDEKLPVVTGLAPGEFLVSVPFDEVKESYPDGRPSIEPVSGSPAAILKIPEEVRQDYLAQGQRVLDPVGYLIFCLAAELRPVRDRVLTAELVDFYLSKLKVRFPALVNVARYYFSPEELALKLRERLSAQSSIRNLPVALEAVLGEMNLHLEIPPQEQ
jgi:tetratricopeptide (TPR) repeat protein